FARVSNIREPLETDDAAADFAIEFIQELCQRIRIPPTLTEIGVTSDQIPALVKSSRGNSMSANPRHLDDGELTAVLEGLL
ncbi:MAG: hypothetical protein CMJ78_05495, partial [Planctomycetaceae bacterium]|nr:hypothetical protein [Planctomycetaceae bacterium]